jgi:hypothetical protein
MSSIKFILGLLVGVVCVGLISAQNPGANIYPFPQSSDPNDLYGSPLPHADLTLISSSLEFLTYDAPNFCAFYPSDNNTIATPRQPSDWFAQYQANGNVPPALQDNEKATVTAALFHFQFDNSQGVYIHGRSVADPFWWNPNVYNPLTGGSSFDQYTTGCAYDSGEAAVNSDTKKNNVTYPIAAGLQQPDTVASLPINTTDFYDYARSYRLGKASTQGAWQFKLPNRYCPYLDPLPRYPIWRDYQFGTFAAWELNFFDPALGQNVTIPNHINPRWNLGTADTKTCGLPYYSFLLPKSRSFPDSDLLLRAQHMLPMPDDLVPNAFTIVYWMATHSWTGAQGQGELIQRLYPRGLEAGSATINFKTPNSNDRLDSCGVVDLKISDYTDGQIIPSMTGMKNDTESTYVPTPDIHDKTPPAPAVDPKTHQVVQGAYADQALCASWLGQYASCSNPTGPTGILTLWKQTNPRSPRGATGPFPWPTYPNFNPCDLNRGGQYFTTPPTKAGQWIPYTCSPSGAATTEFDGALTVGWCIKASEVKTNKWALTDVNGNPLQGSVGFVTNSAKPCSPDDFQAIQNEAAFLIANLSNAQSINDAVLFEAALSRLAYEYSFGSCFTYIKSLFRTKTSVVPVPAPPGQCATSAANPTAFANDPCCNPGLAFSQCCKNSQGTTSQNVITVSEFSDAITSGNVCRNPALAQAALLDFQSISNSAATAPAVSTGDNAAQLWQKFIQVKEFCYNAIQQQSCQKDSDCYSQECDAFRGVCIVPYENLYDVTVDCLNVNLQDSLRASFLSKLNLAADATDVQVKAAFRSQFADQDCVGPTADLFRSKEVYDPATGASFIAPGDQTRCEASRKCSYALDDGEVCADPKKVPYISNNFCGVCHGNSCWEISQQAKCIVTAFSQRDMCEMAGFYWLPTVDDTYFSDLDGNCLNLNATTEAQCLPTTVCPKSNSAARPNDAAYRCQGSICFSLAKTITTCTDGQWAIDWGAGLGLCTTFHDPIISSPDYVPCKLGFSSYWGFKWVPGVWDTPAKCAVGQCSLQPNVYQFGSADVSQFNASTCAKYSQCTQGCPTCVAASETITDQFAGSICYDPLFSNPSKSKCGTARSVNGKTIFGTYLTVTAYYRGAKFTKNICQYNLNATECSKAKFTRISCRDLDRNTCGNSQVVPTSTNFDELLYMSLSCAWNPSYPCLTQQQCSSAGKCDDDEFIDNDFVVNGQPTTGGCVFKAGYLLKTTSYVPCETVPTKYYKTLDYLTGKNAITFRRKVKKPGYCVDVTYSSPSDCSADGGYWDQVASNQTSCLGHGNYCYDLADGSRSNRTGDACTTCGGVVQPAYSWVQGNWLTGFMRSTQWRSRSLIPINQWVNTLNYTRLYQTITSAAAPIVTSQVTSAQQFQALTQMISIMSQVICDCTDPTLLIDNQVYVVDPLRNGTSCYSSTNPLAPAIVARVYNLNPTQWQTSGATYNFNASTGGTDFTVVQIPFATTWAISGTTATNGTTPTQYRRLLAAPGEQLEVNQGAIAYDSNGLFAGMVVGKGQRITVNVQPGTLTVTFSVDYTLVNLIDRSIYYEPAVGQLINNQIVIMDLKDVTMLNDESAIRTPEIYSSGEYYAVFAAGPQRKVPPQYFPGGVAEKSSLSAASINAVSFTGIIAIIVASLALLF